MKVGREVYETSGNLSDHNPFAKTRVREYNRDKKKKKKQQGLPILQKDGQQSTGHTDD